jgi:hypothetical protein
MNYGILPVDSNKPFREKGPRNGNIITFAEGLDHRLVEQIYQPNSLFRTTMGRQ